MSSDVAVQHGARITAISFPQGPAITCVHLISTLESFQLEVAMYLRFKLQDLRQGHSRDAGLSAGRALSKSSDHIA